MNSITLNKWSNVVLPMPARYQTTVTRDGKVLFLETEMMPFINQDQRNFCEDFTIHQLDQEEITSILLKDMPFPPTDFDTFTDGTLLVSSARCPRTDDWILKNAGRYSFDGECLDNFVLGDGIYTLAIDDEDHIWVGYFDEGVYGNMGWDQPIGHSGLVAFSAKGDILFRPKLPMIHELLSLNVQRADSVFAYYTLFSSVIHLDHYKEVLHENIDEKISVGPITLINEALITFEYDSKSLIILKKHENTYQKEKSYVLKDNEGRELYDQDTVIRIRGNRLYLFNDTGVYMVELTEEIVR